MPDHTQHPEKGGLSRSPKSRKQRAAQAKQPASAPEDDVRIKQDLNHIKELLSDMRSYLKK